MNLKEVIDYSQIVAMADKLAPTETSIWITICRFFSKNYNTPLQDIIDGKVDPELVCYVYYADQLENLDEDEDLEKMMDIVNGITDPAYRKAKEAELEEFIKDIEEEERERVKSKTSLTKFLIKKQKKKKQPPKEMPKSGGINLAYLSKEEEGNEGGFED